MKKKIIRNSRNSEIKNYVISPFFFISIFFTFQRSEINQMKGSFPSFREMCIFLLFLYKVCIVDHSITLAAVIFIANSGK